MGRRVMAERTNEANVKELMVGAIKTAGDVANAAIDALRGSLVSVLTGTRQVTTEATTLISSSVRGIIQAAAETGQDRAKAASGTVVGVVRAATEAGAEAIAA